MVTEPSKERPDKESRVALDRRWFLARSGGSTLFFGKLPDLF